AEEPRCIGIGAVAEVLEPAHAGGGEAGGNIAGKIEQGVLRRRRGPEESFVRSVLGLEAGDEFGSDLVIRLADGRPQRGPRARSPPPRSRAAIVASRTPVAAPRQPAWATPMTPAVSSANSTGPQSAVVMPMASPGTAVTIASARGRSCGRHGRSIVTTSGEWTWEAGSRESRCTPSAAAMRARFSATLAGAAAGPGPPLEPPMTTA